MTEQPLVMAIDAALQQAISLDAPLDQRLGMIRDAVSALSVEFAAAVDRLVARLEAGGAGHAAPAPGQPMPPFVLPDEAGRLVAMPQLLAKGPVVVNFHRGHWCPYCRLHRAALAEIAPAISAAGAQLVIISPERGRYAAQMRAETADHFPVLTDMDNGYAMSLNLVIWLGTELQAMLGGAGWDVAAYQGNPAWMLPVPATFVVGTDGLVAARHVDADYRRRMAVEDLLAAVQRAR
jgi:peroxiredoxin